MSRTPLFALALGLAAAASASAASGGPGQDAVVAAYAEKAKAADPAFTGFDAAAGKAFFFAKHAGGGPDTPSCTSCHTENIAEPGQTRAGKTIDPMAPSVTADRLTDLAKVEKWIRRNCNSVLGRDCTAKEAGDVVSWLASQ
jgi:cytochrome c peroxidase